ncbi:CBASS cGAMP-activated phospholipase [Ramlibacter alkalitolerans]|uniref:Patatin-like phospholipase family protein n=1 Tax=Ramlibacter alkalitolerans TaxID=2039631 RepID=A0ABS1JXD9_9BURK|nr:CBASS cGAMP-activated phospholipase [Ramlibacter alkalitolerans]MBL0428741.1 patatin-like phospholipase family protein [Ramlibacter alkalitolerans]
MSKPFRVLSLDGGGIRGLYSAALLQQLTVRIARLTPGAPEERLDLGAKFDLIVGTSTGSIIAVALAAGLPLEDVVEMYRRESRHIFQRPMPLKGGCFSGLQRLLWTLKNVTGPANRSDALRTALTAVLKDETLGQVYERRKVALCVPSVDAETGRAWVFKTPHARRLTRDNNYRLVDVCMASAAAPIYFPLHRIPSPNPGSKAVHSFVDGGLWANDPVMVAVTEALEVAADRDIQIVSVGTCSGAQSQPLSDKDASRGIWGWKGGADIVSASLEAQAFATPYLAKTMAKAMSGRVTMFRMEEPDTSDEESRHLALDAVDDKSLRLLEMLAQRATDKNSSVLTNTTLSPERSMVLDVFSGLAQAK